MFAVGDAMTATVAPQPPAAPAVDSPGSVSMARGRVPIADELREALRQSHGNVAEAARQFGCSRQQIYRWMRAVGVELDEFRPSGASR
jgi:transcriptional regulator of acetoin/glycerol metabolism